MHLPTLFLSLLAATTVIAKGNSNNSNGTEPVTDKSLCKEMTHLEKLITTAQNSTKLATKTNNNQTKIDAIVSKASEAAVKLDTLQGNSTLVATCAVINEAAQTKKTCNKMEDLQNTIDTASNSTKLTAKTKGNATKEVEWQAKATKAQTKLDSLTSNTTLVDACSALKTQRAEAKAAKDGTSSTSEAAKASSSATSGASGLGGARFGSLVVVVVVGVVGLGML